MRTVCVCVTWLLVFVGVWFPICAASFLVPRGPLWFELPFGLAVGFFAGLVAACAANAVTDRIFTPHPAAPFAGSE